MTVIADPARRILARTLEAAVPSVGVLISVAGALGESGALVRLGGWLFLALSAFVFFANAYLITTRGETVGKGWLGLKIVRPDGSLPGLNRGFLVRELLFSVLGAIPVLGLLVGMADALLLLFGERRRSLHDVLADTIVVDTRAR